MGVDCVKRTKNFTEEDYENYANLMVKTGALHRGNDPESKYPKIQVLNRKYLETFGLKRKSLNLLGKVKRKRKSMRKGFLIQGHIIMERALWLFRAILTRC